MCNSNHNDTNNPQLEIISINKLLDEIEKEKIIIPDYQRPYKWQNTKLPSRTSYQDKRYNQMGLYTR